jgi:hypothetical protein
VHNFGKLTYNLATSSSSSSSSSSSTTTTTSSSSSSPELGLLKAVGDISKRNFPSYKDLP